MNCERGRPASLRVLSIVIHQTVEELGKVKNPNSIIPEFKFKVSDHPSLWQFTKFYDAFTQVIRKNLPPNTSAATSQTVTPSRQTTVPPNPQYSLSSTASTSSRESKAEHHAQAAANDYLWPPLHQPEINLKSLLGIVTAGVD